MHCIYWLKVVPIHKSAEHLLYLAVYWWSYNYIMCIMNWFVHSYGLYINILHISSSFLTVSMHREQVSAFTHSLFLYMGEMVVAQDLALHFWEEYAATSLSGGRDMEYSYSMFKVEFVSSQFTHGITVSMDWCIL